MERQEIPGREPEDGLPVVPFRQALGRQFHIPAGVNDGAAVTQQMEKLQAGEQFRLEPVPPIPAEGLLLAAVNVRGSLPFSSVSTA